MTTAEQLDIAVTAEATDGGTPGALTAEFKASLEQGRRNSDAREALIEARRPHVEEWLTRFSNDGRDVILPLAVALKAPIVPKWSEVTETDWDYVEERLRADGNIGLSLGASRRVCLDGDNAEATAAILAAGWHLHSVSPGSRNPRHGHAGGAHTLWRLPTWVPNYKLTGPSSAVLLENGAKIDVLAGPHQVVLPPSVVVTSEPDEPFHAGTYVMASEAGYCGPERDGWLLEDAGDDLILPLWMLSDEILAYAPPGTEIGAPPPGMEPLAGTIGFWRPKSSKSRDGQADDALTQAVDAWPFLEKIAEAGVLGSFVGYDRCGDNCAMWLRSGSAAAKSLTKHDCDEHGGRVQVWTTAFPNLPQGGYSAIDAYIGLTGGDIEADRGRVLAEQGLITPNSLVGFADTLFMAAERFEDRADDPAWCTGTVRVPDPSEVPTRGPAGNLRTTRAVQVHQTRDYWLDLAKKCAAGARAVRANVPGPGVQVAAQPVTSSDDPGDFPLDALPEPLRAHAEWVAHAQNVPIAMVAPMQLAVLNAACGRAKVRVRPGWAEDAALWFLVIAPPSTRKSPVLAEVRVPMDRAQEELIKQMSALRATRKLDAEVAEAAAEEARQAYKEAADKAALHRRFAGVLSGARQPAPPGVEPPIGSAATETRDLADLAEQVRVLEAAAEAAEAGVPGKVRLFFDDATPEAMQDLLRACRGRGFMLVPEGQGWFDRATRTDSQRMSLVDFLKAYSAEPITVDRILRGEFTIDDPFLAMLLMIQPAALREAMQGRDGTSRLRSNGAWARMATSYVPRVAADRFYNGAKDNEAVKAAYADRIEHEFIRTFTLAHTPQFRLSVGAEEAVAAVYDRVEDVKVAGNSNPDGMVEEWGKLVGRAIRIARMFAQLRVTDAALADPNAVHVIERGDFEAGWEIAYWLIRSQAFAMGISTNFAGPEERLEAAVKWMREAVRKHGVRTERQFKQNKTHSASWQAARDRLAADGEIELTTDGWIPGPNMAAA
ncbi:DUF3987 domain-containing protein [Mycobacteroides abscessus]|uniref:Bifunctional DNA primase/polymerase, N-terminal n=1 Tax=Mycobacteroides abscessus TaxID=36809 RepID=A0AB33T265_9MYCO|nr:DUF3987 domain-containing protein [Mycobacteroides abscessus]CPT03693.1 Bifunctional DNA primase/polymerase%2C N-terminal [Mycobacteroides abscessus]CPT67771.1 Bifunctional DNA primase/polymerase%2C N-terminal [Mycobacteroides abscessus]CPT68995.1 Bifunctional DNA primase/polymerase%2C N-terminal [Mycobacteroides abscessus]CPV12517.1 Bifunctional DNA primase/polymerase%2C N-terminal [Mycobacteroides abscessus]CPV59366.1 Bifunctional DNA primase/polymerase%2C N-terminal [Mycobacteroides absc